MYIAQINGHTMEGSISEIQNEWNELKARFNFSGMTLKFFKADRHGSCYVVSDCNPVKTMLVK